MLYCWEYCINRHHLALVTPKPSFVIDHLEYMKTNLTDPGSQQQALWTPFLKRSPSGNISS
jgi:hypothetical protein